MVRGVASSAIRFARMTANVENDQRYYWNLAGITIFAILVSVDNTVALCSISFGGRIDSLTLQK